MNAREIKTQVDDKVVLERIDTLFEATSNTPDGDELETLIVQVSA